MNFIGKNSEALREQLEKANADMGVSLSQPSKQAEILEMDDQELVDKFPVRYEMYKKMLRNPEGKNGLSEAELADMRKWLGALNNLDGYIETHKEKLQAMEQPTLRPRQFTVFEDLRNFLEEGGKEGYIKLPTGVGKTVVFIEFLKALKLKTLVVVPKNILVDQTIGEIGKFAEDLDVGQINKEAKSFGADVTVITYDSLVQWVKESKLDPKDFDCVILDEAHRALGPETSSVVEDERFSHAVKLGFTATPKFTERKQLKNLLENEIHSLEIAEAVEEGLLSGFKVIIAKTTTDLRGVRVSASGEYNQKDLDKAINNAARTQAAVDLYEKAFAGQKLIAYCGNSVQYAKDVAQAFQDRGIDVEAVYGEQTNTKAGADEQREILRKLSTGEIIGIANAKLLIEGFNEPSASVCFNLAPTQSLVDAEQRGGRVLRLFPDKFAIIVEFLDEHDEEKFPVMFAEIATASVIPPEGSEEKDAKKAQNITAKLNSIQIDGLEVIADPQEVLKVVQEGMEAKYKFRPEGWLSLPEIMEKYNQSYWIVGQAMNKILTDRRYQRETALRVETIERLSRAAGHPVHLLPEGEYERISKQAKEDEWYQSYRIPTEGTVAKHCHPDFITQIQKDLSEHERTRYLKEVPPGWRKYTEVRDELKIGEKTFELYLKEALKKHPGGFQFVQEKGDKRSVKGRATRYLSPDVISYIAQKQSREAVSDKRPEAKDKVPEGAIPKAELAKYLQIDYDDLTEIINRQRPNEQQVIKGPAKGKQIVEFLLPDYVAQLMPKLYKLRRYEPKGWENRGSANWRKGLVPYGKPPIPLEEIYEQAEQYRKTYPYMFWQLSNPEGKLMAEYYSPDLKKKIAGYFKSREQ